MSSERSSEMVDWSDGADQGIGAESAMKATLGSDEPLPKSLSPAEMRAMLEAAPLEPQSYDGGANAAGRLVLEFLDRHPEMRDMPADSEHDWPKLPSGETDWNGTAILVREGLYDAMKRAEPDWFAEHRDKIWGNLTGFMWGWAVNAARYSLDLPPVPNPALLVI